MYEALSFLSDRFYVAEGRADIIQFIRDIYGKFQEWKKHNSILLHNSNYVNRLVSKTKPTHIESALISTEHAANIGTYLGLITPKRY